MKRKKPIQGIHVAESPPPTLMTCSPFKPTPKPKSRMSSADRRGGKRSSYHQRSTTLQYSPTIPHHCGYACVLKVSALHVQARTVRKLRERVAHEIVEKYWRGDTIYDIDVREIVTERGLNIDAYAMEIKNRQWASILEIAVACDLYQLLAKVIVPDKICHFGDCKDRVPIAAPQRSHWVILKGKPRSSRASSA